MWTLTKPRKKSRVSFFSAAICIFFGWRPEALSLPVTLVYTAQPFELLIVDTHLWSGFSHQLQSIIQRRATVDQQPCRHGAGAAEAATAVDIQNGAVTLAIKPTPCFC